MRSGYARVSKGQRQDPAPQVAALKEDGCERIYIDRVAFPSEPAAAGRAPPSPLGRVAKIACLRIVPIPAQRKRRRE
jgi:hypothetical protein